MYPLWMISHQLIVEPTADELHAIYDMCITYFKLGFDMIADIAYTISCYDYCRQTARDRFRFVVGLTAETDCAGNCC